MDTHKGSNSGWTDSTAGENGANGSIVEKWFMVGGTGWSSGFWLSGGGGVRGRDIVEWIKS